MGPIQLWLSTVALAAACVAQESDVPRWPSFRGEFACGVADDAPLPATWDVESGEGVVWKRPIPGLCHSSPIVWGDRLFVTTAVRDGDDGDGELRVGLYGAIEPVADEAEHSFRLICIDRTNGEVAWDRECWKGVPAIQRHPKGTHAASTPATDGEVVVAFFGTEGLHAFSVEGEPLWSVDLGRLDAGFFMVRTAQWGFGSSPVLHGGRVYVQCDVQDQSFVLALDAKTGEQIWRTEREEESGWGTPTVVSSDGREQLVCNGWKHMGGYDLATGEPLWWLSGGGDIPVPTPVAGHGLVFLTNAHGRNSPVLAIDLAAEGELSIDPEESEGTVWGIRRGGNYMQTPIVYGDHLYCCKDMGVVTCFGAADGQEHYKQRLTAGVGYTASPVAGDGKVYFTSEEGEVHVVKAGPEFELLGVVPMHEVCMATPAIAAGQIYFRTRSQIVAVGVGEGDR